MNNKIEITVGVAAVLLITILWLISLLLNEKDLNSPSSNMDHYDAIEMARAMKPMGGEVVIGTKTDSMLPFLGENTVFVIEPANKLLVGDLVYIRVGGRLCIHAVTNLTPLVTKGYNNSKGENPDEVLGRVRWIGFSQK